MLFSEEMIIILYTSEVEKIKEQLKKAIIEEVKDYSRIMILNVNDLDFNKYSLKQLIQNNHYVKVRIIQLVNDKERNIQMLLNDLKSICSYTLEIYRFKNEMNEINDNSMIYIDNQAETIQLFVDYFITTITGYKLNQIKENEYMNVYDYKNMMNQYKTFQLISYSSIDLPFKDYDSLYAKECINQVIQEFKNPKVLEKRLLMASFKRCHVHDISKLKEFVRSFYRDEGERISIVNEYYYSYTKEKIYLELLSLFQNEVSYFYRHYGPIILSKVLLSYDKKIDDLLETFKEEQGYCKECIYYALLKLKKDIKEEYIKYDYILKRIFEFQMILNTDALWKKELNDEFKKIIENNVRNNKNIKTDILNYMKEKNFKESIGVSLKKFIQFICSKNNQENDLKQYEKMVNFDENIIHEYACMLIAKNKPLSSLTNDIIDKRITLCLPEYTPIFNHQLINLVSKKYSHLEIILCPSLKISLIIQSLLSKKQY